MEPTSWRVVLVISLIGIGLSSYLTVVSFVSTDLSFCEPYPFLSCDAVIQSQYSRILGIPVALIGTLGFVSLFAVAYIALVFEMIDEKRLVLLSTLLSIAGLAFGAYLTYIEVVVIRSICILCLLAFLLILPILVISLRGWLAIRGGV